MDCLVDADEFLQTVAIDRNRELASAGYNAISVSSTNYLGSGTPVVDSDYPAGRTSPHVMVPQNCRSAASPVVASVAAILVGLGHDQPVLSADPNEQSTTNRARQTIYNAERSEVVNAAVMAGADRVTHNSAYDDILNYRQDAQYQTDNGLDIRYGAGQLNIYNSYRIIAGWEFNCLEDEAGPNGAIGTLGFDYEPCFGGEDNCNDTATYIFNAEEEYLRLWAALVWNVAVEEGTFYFDGTITPPYLQDLTLTLFEKDGLDQWVAAASSDSGTDNTENLYTPLAAGKAYKIEVARAAGTITFSRDLVFAWRIEKPYDRDGDGIPDEWDAFAEDAADWLDTDEHGIGNKADTDDDDDGMPDDFESAYAPTLDPLVNDGQADPDGDGFANIAEYQAGTDSTDENAYPRSVSAISFEDTFIISSMLLFIGCCSITKQS